MSARLKVLARKASSGVQGILRSRIEALPRLLQADPKLSCIIHGEIVFCIDIENGSDETGDGSRERPFRSDAGVRAFCAERGYRILGRKWGGS